MKSLAMRALRARDLVKARASRSAKARLVLADLLARAGYPVGLVVIHTWPRHVQGEAYLWARAFLDGREDLDAPLFVQNACQKDYRQTVVVNG